MLKKKLFLLIIAPFVVTCTAEALAASGVPSVMTEQNAQGFLISLNAESVSFESLLRDLTEQCRISITGTGDAPLLQPVSIRFKDLPLEQAIGRLFKAAGIHNYLIRYSEGESCRPRITGINILSSPGQPEATGNHADRLVYLEQQKPGAHTNVPLSERDQFLEKITSFRNRYAWESEEILNRAVYLLQAMPAEVKSPGLDTIMKELDRACGPGKGAEVGEEIFYRAIEAAAPPGMAPVMMEQVRRLSERYRSDVPVNGPEEPSGDSTQVFRNEGRQSP